MAPVEESWTRIVDWLRGSARATAAAFTTASAPTARPDLEEVERVLGRPLPADLAQWWRLASDASGAERLIPIEHTPLSVADALRVRREHLDRALRHGESIVDGEAGEPSRGFQSAFLPIASDPHGRHLFVDLRGGTLHGCVGEWDDIGRFVDVITWPSVAEMLSDIADALVHGVPALTFHAAGRLRHFAGHPEIPVLTYRASVTPAGHLIWTT